MSDGGLRFGARDAFTGAVSLWRGGARALANVLPKGLYARSLLIVIVPMVLLQGAVAYVFMQRHLDLVTHRLSAGVASDVGAIDGSLSRSAVQAPTIAGCARSPPSVSG